MTSEINISKIGENMIEIINIIAIVLGPIAAVLITRYVQVRSERRKEKSEIFRTLMTYRGQGWSNYECVNCLNMIEVVFYDNQDVVDKWKDLFEKYCKDQLDQSDQLKIATAQHKLLEAMAKCLGYSDHIDWDTIQHSYVPQWLSNNNLKQQELFDAQLAIAKSIECSAGQKLQRTDMQ